MKPEHHIVRDVIAAQYWMEDWAFGRAIAKADQFIDLLERREAEEQKKTAERPMMDAELREEERLRKANDPVGSGLPSAADAIWYGGKWLYSKAEPIIADRDKTIAELKEEVENLRKMIDPKIEQLHFENGRLDLAASSPMFKILIAGVVDILREFGGENYLSIDMRDSRDDTQIEVLIRYIDGKTPAQLNVELRAENERLRAEKEKRYDENC